jgi:hypothetical protein
MSALTFLARYKLLTGSIEEVIPLADQGIRLSPRDPVIALPLSTIGVVHLLQSRVDEAILWFEKAPARVREHSSRMAIRRPLDADSLPHRRRGSRRDGGSRPLLLGHAGLAQAGEIRCFEQGADFWRPPRSAARISNGRQTGDARKTPVAT